MTERFVPDLGALPWKPKRGTSLVRELNRWDIPTSGIIRNRWTFRHHLFQCLDGATTQFSVWAYVPLSRTEVRELVSLEGDALRQLQDRLMASRTLSIAVAEEDAGIVHRAHGRLVRSYPEPRLESSVSVRVQQEIQAEARALRDMPVFAK